MARIACTKEGARQFEELAGTLRGLIEELQEAGLRLHNSIPQTDQEVFAKIEDLIREVLKTTSESADGIKLLSERCLKLAENIRDVLSGTGGIDVTGGAGETGAAAGQNTGDCCDKGSDGGEWEAYEALDGSGGSRDDQCGTVKRAEWEAENNAIYEQFEAEFIHGEIELEQTTSNDLAWVNASDIIGSRYHDTEGDEEFWSHHGNNRQMFVELAVAIPEVSRLLEEGVSLEEIKKDEHLRACAEQYFTIDEKRQGEGVIKVYRYGDKYVSDQGGRHRIEIAKELGIKLPVLITHVVKKKISRQE